MNRQRLCKVPTRIWLQRPNLLPRLVKWIATRNLTQSTNASAARCKELDRHFAKRRKRVPAAVNMAYASVRVTRWVWQMTSKRLTSHWTLQTCPGRHQQLTTERFNADCCPVHPCGVCQISGWRRHTSPDHRAPVGWQRTCFSEVIYSTVALVLPISTVVSGVV